MFCFEDGVDFVAVVCDLPYGFKKCPPIVGSDLLEKSAAVAHAAFLFLLVITVLARIL